MGLNINISKRYIAVRYSDSIKLHIKVFDIQKQTLVFIGVIAGGNDFHHGLFEDAAVFSAVKDGQGGFILTEIIADIFGIGFCQINLQILRMDKAVPAEMLQPLGDFLGEASGSVLLGGLHVDNGESVRGQINFAKPGVQLQVGSNISAHHRHGHSHGDVVENGIDIQQSRDVEIINDTPERIRDIIAQCGSEEMLEGPVSLGVFHLVGKILMIQNKMNWQCDNADNCVIHGNLSHELGGVLELFGISE